jgi:hypothetical protein
LADSNQYLRLSLDGKHYLLLGSASIAIEQRDALVLDGATPPIAAWRQAHLERWPAYALDGLLRPVRRTIWQRAVFLDAKPHAVGMVVDEVTMLARTDLPIAPFFPLGPAATSAGHLFTGAWVDGNNVTLVFDPPALSAYLQAIGRAA